MKNTLLLSLGVVIGVTVTLAIIHLNSPNKPLKSEQNYWAGPIGLQDADEWVKRFQDSNHNYVTTIPDNGDERNILPVKSWFIHYDALRDMLNMGLFNRHRSGIRIFPALRTQEYGPPGHRRTTKGLTLVVVGTKWNSSSQAHDNEGTIYEYVDPCPNMCNTDSDLQIGR